MAREAWAARAVLGVPAGGRDLWLGATPAAAVTASDLQAGGAALAALDEARDLAAEEHNRRCHPHSPFVQADWADYCRAMQARSAVAGCAGGSGSSALQLDSTAFHDLQPAHPCLAHDQSIAEFVAAQPLGAELAGNSSSGSGETGAPATLSSTVSGVLRALLVDTEQYEGAPLSRLSAAHGGEQLSGVPGADMQVASGYGALLCGIAAREQVRVHCDTVVTAVDVALDCVRVRATRLDPLAQPAASAHGSSARPVERPAPPADPRTLAGTPVTYRARYVLVTVPLGVLQRGHISFSPPLPRWKTAAIDALGYGLLNKTVLQFDRPWWDDELRDQRTGDARPDSAEGVSPARPALSRTNVINVLPAAGSDEPPLWIVSMSRALTAAQSLNADSACTPAQGQTATSASDRNHDRDGAWQTLMSNARPLAPSCQLEDTYIAGNVHEEDGEEQQAETPSVPAPAPALAPLPCMQEGATVAAGATAAHSLSTSGVGVAPLAPPPSAPSLSLGGSPHVLVSFSSCFDAASDFRASAAEAHPDSAVVAALMRRLRRAFGDEEQRAEEEGTETAAAAADESKAAVRVLSVSTDAEVVQRHTIDAGAAEQSGAATTGPASASLLSVPTSFSFSAPRYTTLARRRRGSGAAAVVPDPIGYVVTRWGLESHSHGAYAHFRPGTGPHTCAELARPVRVRVRPCGPVPAPATVPSATADPTATVESTADLECVEEDASGQCTAEGPATANGAIASAAPSSSCCAPASAPAPAPTPAPSSVSLPSAVRLLWAGEATLGVHLGCADSAWLSGVREAKRIAALWDEQDHSTSLAVAATHQHQRCN